MTTEKDEQVEKAWERKERERIGPRSDVVTCLLDLRDRLEKLEARMPFTEYCPPADDPLGVGEFALDPEGWVCETELTRIDPVTCELMIGDEIVLIPPFGTTAKSIVVDVRGNRVGLRREWGKGGVTWDWNLREHMRLRRRDPKNIKETPCKTS